MENFNNLEKAKDFFNLALDKIKEESYKEAKKYLELSLLILPNRLSTLVNLTAVMIKLQELDEAEEIVVKTLKNFPDEETLYLNHGLIYEKKKEYEKALNKYQIAIKLNADYAEAYLSCASVYQELNIYEKAIWNLNKAIELRPEYFEAYYNKGIIFHELKQLDDAYDCFKTTIKLNPNYALAYLNLGILQFDLVKFDDSKLSFLQALRLDTELYIARWYLAFLYIPTVALGNENYKQLRKNHVKELIKVYKWFKKENRLNFGYKAVGAIQPFYLAYQEENNKNIILIHGLICNKLMTHWQKNNNLIINASKSTNKFNLGFVSENIRDHSVWNAITKGFILNINKKLFNIHIFHLDGLTDSETELAMENADSYVSNKENLLDWVNAIDEKKIDILIYPEIGMHPLTLQLASLRIASVQVAFWGHPETTGCPTIDYFISSDLFEDENSQSVYSEKLHKLPNLGCFYYENYDNQLELNITKFGISKDIPIFICPGTPFKYAPKFDSIFAKIASRVNCKFIFFEKEKHLSEIIIRRLKKHFDDRNLQISNYIKFIPWLEKGAFFSLMRQSSVFLDTIGFSGFNTAAQAVQCCIPIVTMKGKFLRGRLASGILLKIGVPELIVNSENEYIELALRLVTNHDFYNFIIDKINNNKYKLFNDIEPIHSFEKFVLKLMKDRNESRS